MKRILALLLAACLLCGLLSGCTVEEAPYTPTGDALDSATVPTGTNTPDQQTLSLVYYPDRSLNPYICTDYTNRVLFSLMYQGLFSVDRSYQVQPVLCKNYKVSADMKTYTFFLQKAWFWDGTAMTTQDVIASYEAARKSTYYGGRFQHIKSMKAAGDAIIIELDTAFENLPILLDIPIVKAPQVEAENPLGTGPYLLETLASGKQLRRQPAWWCKIDFSVTAATIPLVEAESVRQIRDAFEFREVDLVCGDPGSETFSEFRCDYELWNCENGMFLYLGCNQQSKVFSNDALRKALTHAFDRDALAETFYHGFAVSASLPASPYSPYYNATLASRYQYDSDKFTAAVTENNALGTEITLLVNSDDALRVRVAKSISDTLNQYGFVVTLLELPLKDFTYRLRAGNYDLYLAQTKLSANMDLSAFFRDNGSLNYGGLSNIALYSINQEALANQGNYYNLHAQVMADGHLIPLLFRSYAIYTTRGVISDLTPARDQIFYYSTGRTLADARMTE